jgi:hypothetical protein
MLSEVIVVPGYFGLLQPSLAAPNALSRDRLETIPQLGEDIYRAVSRLPGVSADRLSAKFNVRGGSGDELFVSLDGLELVEPFHLKDLGGSFSIVDIQSLGTAALTTGGLLRRIRRQVDGRLHAPDRRSAHRSDAHIARHQRHERACHVAGRLRRRQGRVDGPPRGRGYLDIALKLTERARLHAAALLRPVRQGAVRSRRVRARRASRASRAGHLRYQLDDDPNIASRYASDYGWLTWDARFGSRLRVASVASVGALTGAATATRPRRAASHRDRTAGRCDRVGCGRTGRWT